MKVSTEHRAQISVTHRPCDAWLYAQTCARKKIHPRIQLAWPTTISVSVIRGSGWLVLQAACTVNEEKRQRDTNHTKLFISITILPTSLMMSLDNGRNKSKFETHFGNHLTMETQMGLKSEIRCCAIIQYRYSSHRQLYFGTKIAENGH